MPLVGVRARSAAITPAAPRKNANGDALIRPNRMGTRSSSRPSLDAFRIAMGFARSRVAFHPAWEARGTWSRSARALARRSSGDRGRDPALALVRAPRLSRVAMAGSLRELADGVLVSTASRCYCKAREGDAVGYLEIVERRISSRSKRHRCSRQGNYLPYGSE
jgi:hypothetical protein